MVGPTLRKKLRAVISMSSKMHYAGCLASYIMRISIHVKSVTKTQSWRILKKPRRKEPYTLYMPFAKKETNISSNRQSSLC